MRKPTRSAINPDLAKRAEVLAGPHYCTNYRQHGPHQLTMHMSAWVGGGIEQVTCPGHATDDTQANFEACVAVHKR
jgi:hypothetical protein